MTSLETILDKHKISKYKLIKAMGNKFEDNEYHAWYQRIAGTRRVTEAEVTMIKVALQRLHIKEEFSYEVYKYLIV